MWRAVPLPIQPPRPPPLTGLKALPFSRRPAVAERTVVFYWLLKYVFLGPLLRLIFRPDVRGLDNVPENGPVILACNHLSFSDSIFTPLLVARRVTFVAKPEFCTGRRIKGRLMRRLFFATGTI